MYSRNADKYNARGAWIYFKKHGKFPEPKVKRDLTIYRKFSDWLLKVHNNNGIIKEHDGGAVRQRPVGERDSDM